MYLTAVSLKDPNSQFWSPPSSRRYPPSLPTHTLASASPSSRSGSSIPPTMHVLTHSYSSEIALVDEIKLVIGGRSLRTRRGSNGVKIANCCQNSLTKLTSLTTLINIQLLLLLVKISNNSGARGR